LRGKYRGKKPQLRKTKRKRKFFIGKSRGRKNSGGGEIETLGTSEEDYNREVKKGKN